MALSRSFLHHVTCPVYCPVASSLALALPAVLQQQQLVTSPHAAYHPRASSSAVLHSSSAAGHVTACSLSPESFKLRSTTAAAAGHVTHAAYHPRASKLFLFFSLSTFLLFSLATSATATRSLRQLGCNLSRQKEKCCANSTSYSYHSTCLLYTSPSPRD